MKNLMINMYEVKSQTSVSFHIETSHLICSANDLQWSFNFVKCSFKLIKVMLVLVHFMESSKNLVR